MKYLKGSTKTGQKIIAMGSRWAGDYLEQIYEKYSDEKLKAYNYCKNLYFEGINSRAFSICSANTWQFTVSWFEDFYNRETGELEPTLRVETAYNSYRVFLER